LGRGFFVARAAVSSAVSMSDLTTNDVELLHELMRSAESTSVDALAAKAGRTVGQIRASAAALEKGGCRIQTHPQQGLHLEHVGLGCWADFLESRHPDGLGCQVDVYERTASTQAVARTLARASGDHEGRVVIADFQEAGQGRLGRRWFAEPGECLLLSALSCVGHTMDQWAVRSCVAVAKAVEEVAGVAVQIRWPNDLFMGGRKLAGILLEQVGPMTVIGIGINVNVQVDQMPSEDQGRPFTATSLSTEGIGVWPLHLADRLLRVLDEAIGVWSDQQVMEDWRERCDQLQQEVVVVHDGRRLRGRVMDLDPAFGLMVQIDGQAIVTLPAATTSIEPAAS
jgi:BirA family biotin operon repressor/biotin-[acetyl-CoA-carboxylase] ligase